MDGYVGNYKVTVKRKPRYIIEDLCVGCLECIEACVYKEAQVPRRVQPGPGQAQADLHPLPAGRAAGGGDRPRDLHRVQDRQVQEDLRGSLRRPQRHRLQAEGGDRRDRGRHHHPGHRLQDSSTPSGCPTTATALYPERLHRAGGRAAGQRLRPDRRRNRPARRPHSRRRSGIIHCVGAATRTPTAGARASAACTR